MDPQSPSFRFGSLPPLRQFTWNPEVKSVPGLSSWSVLCGKKENGLREEIKLNLTRNQILHS